MYWAPAGEFVRFLILKALRVVDQQGQSRPLTKSWPFLHKAVLKLAACFGAPPAESSEMGTKSREYLFGATVRILAERARDARKDADTLACQAWNARMLGFQGPAQPSPALGGALNAGYRYLEVKCLGCDTHQTVPLDIVRRPKTTPIHELERYMRCKRCSELQERPFKRSHLVALRTTKISTSNPPSVWWPGERQMKLTDQGPYSSPEAAARKLIELAAGIEVQDCCPLSKAASATSTPPATRKDQFPGKAMLGASGFSSETRIWISVARRSADDYESRVAPGRFGAA